MIGSQSRRGTIDFGLDGPIPRDILVLMACLFVTYSLSAFQATLELVAAAQLSRAIWQEGFFWQFVTYPFAAGYGNPLGLILSLWMILVFGKQVYYFVGRKAFWKTFFSSTMAAAGVAVTIQYLMDWAGMSPTFFLPFGMMQGQLIVLTVLITGFATLYGHSTIYLMFVLPVKASWFIGLEILFAFLAFLSSKDLAGFIGICTAVTVAYFLFSGVSPKRFLHEIRLRIQRKLIEARLRRMRKGKGKGGDDGVVQGPWVH